ncbi:hypothetical protein [Solirubrobacter soli]|uniref:hypothetical protein n=1 Tax=Solirubrobacter soli TaxID=363832 RepID=UPI000423F13B|nr:hypothetical protein [Solirubrobacter soli]
MRTAERRPKRTDAAPRTAPRPDALGPAGLLALQRGAGNAAVARMLAREPVAEAPAAAEKGYDFEVTIDTRPMRFHGLTPVEAVKKLRLVWRMAHDMLDTGRAENQRQVERRQEHRIAGFWSDLLGGAELPDPDMWNEVGRGALADVRDVLDSTDAALQKSWAAGEALIDRGLPPELERNPLMQAALAFDATQERIERATRLLEKAAADLRECQRKLDEYVDASIQGASRAITGIKVTIVVLEAGAGGAAASAVKGAGLLGQAAIGAGTTAGLGAAEETFNQIGEMRIGEREHFDVAKIGKRGAKDLVTGFVGGVIGGKFSQVLGGRLAKWGATVSDEVLAANGLSRASLAANGPQLFADWVAGSVASSPFTTATGALMDRALEGKWTVKTWGDFADHVLDDMITSGAMGGFLTFAGHAVSKPAAKPVEPAAGRGPVSDGVPQAIHEPGPPPEALVGAVERAKAKTTAKPPSAARPRTEEDYAGSRRPRSKGARPFHHKDPVAPVRETKIKPDDGRKYHESAEKVRAEVGKALREVRRAAVEKAKESGVPPEIDGLIAEIAKTDAEFAGKVREYYEAMSSVDFVQEQMVFLWEQARINKRTVAEELHERIGGGREPNEFRTPKKGTPEEEFAQFLAIIKDPRMMVDLPFSGIDHGAHIHAFQQYLGDQLWGAGKGLEFRLKLAELKGPAKTHRAGGTDQYDEPFWAQLWDELFDSFGQMNSPEKLFNILMTHLDFPYWDS